jgi:hypothetical protein
MHIIIRIFEVHETLRATMAMQLRDLLAQYDLLNKVMSYLKYEGTNLKTFTMFLTNIMFCGLL